MMVFEVYDHTLWVVTASVVGNQAFFGRLAQLQLNKKRIKHPKWIVTTYRG